MPHQFRLAGCTYSDGAVRYRSRRYFVGPLEVYHSHSRYEGTHLVAVFTTTAMAAGDEVSHLKMMPCDKAVLANEMGDLDLRICLDESDLKFALVRG